MSTGSILYIEDESFIGKTIVNKLKDNGFDADLAHDGESGLAMAEKKPYKLILLDLILPKANGFEVLEMLKKNDATKSIPVVVFSNQSTETDQQRAKELGAYEFRVKVHSTPNEIVALAKSLLV